jgi:hypothetical protein
MLNHLSIFRPKNRMFCDILYVESRGPCTVIYGIRWRSIYAIQWRTIPMRVLHDTNNQAFPGGFDDLLSDRV